jgi:cytochrome c biogenesis protein CcmG/thiol:disulfide interchange protein DsbE
MLNVWASWCVPCREEHPLVIELTNRGIVPVYGLNYKDTRDAANKWLVNLGNPFQATLFDADGRVGIDFGVYGVPETFIVDKKGIVRMKHTGQLTPDVVRDKLEPLVKTLQAQS